jgi:hypothetical protein
LLTKAFCSEDEGQTWHKCYLEKKTKAPSGRTQVNKAFFRSPRLNKGRVSIGRNVLTWYANNGIHEVDYNYEIDHIDGDHTNDKLSNLERVTPSENKRRRNMVKESYLKIDVDDYDMVDELGYSAAVQYGEGVNQGKIFADDATLYELANAISDEYGVDPDLIVEDVDELVDVEYAIKPTYRHKGVTKAEVEKRAKERNQSYEDALKFYQYLMAPETNYERVLDRLDSANESLSEEEQIPKLWKVTDTLGQTFAVRNGNYFYTEEDVRDYFPHAVTVTVAEYYDEDEVEPWMRDKFDEKKKKVSNKMEEDILDPYYDDENKRGEIPAPEIEEEKESLNEEVDYTTYGYTPEECEAIKRIKASNPNVFVPKLDPESHLPILPRSEWEGWDY